MQLHGTPLHRHTAPLFPDAKLRHALEIATARAKTALYSGRLLTPGEAMAVACGAAREKETLFSIARTTGWEIEVDVDDLEALLKQRFPKLA